MKASFSKMFIIVIITGFNIIMINKYYIVCFVWNGLQVVV